MTVNLDSVRWPMEALFESLLMSQIEPYQRLKELLRQAKELALRESRSA
jgi:hypothetical protein